MDSFLAKFNRSVPRYTSYPTAPQFYPLEDCQIQERFHCLNISQQPLSLYIHIPFCKTMCLFCGCSVVLNRRPERQQLYLDHVHREVELVASQFSSKKAVVQLHLGGGTPTSLTFLQFSELMQHLHCFFHILKGGEISIEIDPRTVYEDNGEKLKVLKQLGFNRVSFGVQDLDPLVQEAVKRRQSEEMTTTTYYRARELQFEGINIDLIYGLPHQTKDRFLKTVEKLVVLKPDRIALYSYAKVPWIKMHQKAIREETLPTMQEKMESGTVYFLFDRVVE